jgi:hypothetical protein
MSLFNPFIQDLMLLITIVSAYSIELELFLEATSIIRQVRSGTFLVLLNF